MTAALPQDEKMPPRARVHALPFQGSDEALWRLLKQQNSSSMRLLYERFSKQVHGLTWRVLGPDAEHDDVVQEVFEQLFLSVGKLRDPSALEHWVTSVTLNVSRSVLRKRRLRSWVGLSRDSDDDASLLYSHDYEARDLVAKVYRVLDKLPAEERVMFALRYLEQRSVPEIASMCDCSRATVNRRLARATSIFKRHARVQPGLAERITSNERRML